MAPVRPIATVQWLVDTEECVMADCDYPRVCAIRVCEAYESRRGVPGIRRDLVLSRPMVCHGPGNRGREVPYRVLSRAVV